MVTKPSTTPKSTAAKAPAKAAPAKKAPAKKPAPKPVLPTLGQQVEYITRKGHIKLAFVTGTPETIDAGTSIPTLEPGQLNLIVCNQQRGTSNKVAVPNEELRKAAPEFKQKSYGYSYEDISSNEDDKQLVNFWRPLTH